MQEAEVAFTDDAAFQAAVLYPDISHDLDLEVVLNQAIDADVEMKFKATDDIPETIAKKLNE